MKQNLPALAAYCCLFLIIGNLLTGCDADRSITISNDDHATLRGDTHAANSNDDAMQHRYLNNKNRPMPTKAQQVYADHEIVVLIHFNIGTYAGNGDPSCNRDNWLAGNVGYQGQGSGNPAVFNPYLLDTDQWARVFQKLGAKHAVLTAKHGCGFLLWPSEVPIQVQDKSLPYTYAVGQPGISAISYDLLDRFVTSMRKVDMGVGFYYSLKNNFYLNRKDHHEQYNTSITPLLAGQIETTKEEYESMALGHLRELWTRYGPLTEHWFDNGYTLSIRDRLKALLDELQPDMIVWRGQNLTQSTVAWVGTESGYPASDDIWSTGCVGGTGDPDAVDWCPKGCDTTLQNDDCWFYSPEETLRSLDTLVTIYHKTVGRNGVLELDVAPDKTGRIRYDHAKRYEELGDYIRACYGSPLQSWQNQTGYVLDFDLRGSSTINLVDRIMLREDQWSGGQRVRHYKVYVQLLRTDDGETDVSDDPDEWVIFSEGHSIGNKRIDVLPTASKTLLVTKVRVHVIAATDVPMFREIAIFAPCADPNEFVSPVGAADSEATVSNT